MIQSIDQAAQALEKLRRAGVHIALDDFGVGYSSLNYLSNLPVDIIKIDRSLTRQILTSPKQYALLKSIVEMASINELSVVAEGVETRAEQQAIANSGVHYIQGYYYACLLYTSTVERAAAHAAAHVKSKDVQRLRETMLGQLEQPYEHQLIPRTLLDFITEHIQYDALRSIYGVLARNFSIGRSIPKLVSRDLSLIHIDILRSFSVGLTRPETAGSRM